MTEKLHCTCCGRFAPGGLKIYGTIICRSCERQVTRLKAEDRDYGRWMRTMRALWERWEARVHAQQLENPDL